MLVVFCDMFSSSDTQPSSNYRHREAVCCISGNRESRRELLEFYITKVLGSENSSNSDPSGKAAWRRNVAGFHGPLGKAERLGLF